MALLNLKSSHFSESALELWKMPSGRASITPLLAITLLSGTVFALLFADALLQERAFFDTWLLERATTSNSPTLEAVAVRVNELTDDKGAIAAWTVALAGTLALRWWMAALAVFVIPVGGMVNEAAGMIAGRDRPSADEFARAIETTANSFPSGHVTGAVLLYGLLFVLAGRIENALIRRGTRAAFVAIIVLTGPARLWFGAHWPSDILGAYALGAIMLAAIVYGFSRAERAWVATQKRLARGRSQAGSLAQSALREIKRRDEFVTPAASARAVRIRRVPTPGRPEQRL
jgi:membrane-associated phospholipid phosphatase